MADASINNSSGNTTLQYSLLLFAVSAKLWITLHNNNNNNNKRQTTTSSNSSSSSCGHDGNHDKTKSTSLTTPLNSSGDHGHHLRRQHRQHRQQQQHRSNTVEAWKRRNRLSKQHQQQQQHDENNNNNNINHNNNNVQRRRSRLSYDKNDPENKDNSLNDNNYDNDDDNYDWEEDETGNYSDDNDDCGNTNRHQQQESSQIIDKHACNGSSELKELKLKLQLDLLERERQKLMEKISMADSVLCRQTSVDFHPKNSNWSHFEGYTPSFARPDSTPKMTDPITTTYNAKSFDFPTTAAATSPPASIMDEENKNATRTDTLLMGDDDEEEFLWSEPPTTTSSSSTNGLKKTAINLKNTIGKFVSAGMESFHHSGNTTTAERSDDELVPLPTEDMAIDNTQGPISKNNHNDHGDDRLKRLSSEDVRNFNAEIMPSKLIMVRHGQSEGNVNELLYATTPDNAMRLTQLGWEMARMAGKALRKQLPQGETVHFVVSPYARTVETFHGIASAWCDPEEFNHIPSRNKRLKAWYSKLMEMGLTWHEDPRIREQDFGNYQDPEIIKQCKSERHKFGSFYYRMPHGESASDVFDRVSTFLDSLWRSFESQRAQNYVLVTHGIAIRVFLARYFRYSIDQFNMLANPRNCEMVILAHDGCGRLKLDGRCDLELRSVDKIVDESGKNDDEERELANSNAERDGMKKKKGSTTVVVGYKMHKRLRTLPPQYVQARAIRMCHNDAGS